MHCYVISGKMKIQIKKKKSLLSHLTCILPHRKISQTVTSFVNKLRQSVRYFIHHSFWNPEGYLT